MKSAKSKDVQINVRNIIKTEATGKSLDELIYNLESEGKININEVSTKEEVGQECSGFIYNQGGVFYFGIEKSQSSVRKRFTKAHELGHYFLHRDRLNQKDLLLDKNDLKTVILFRNHGESFHRTDVSCVRDWEVEANEFAAELLMPHTEVEERVKRMKNIYGMILIDVLAFDFKVSPGAMEFRIKNLGLL